MPPTLVSDYFYNRQIARVPQGQINEVALTILLGDGSDDAPTWLSLAQMPADAVTNASSPAHRHSPWNEGANYCFTDGHVKWLRPAKISNAVPNPEASIPRFALR